MNCPACHTDLRELPTPEGVTIDFCSTCRGSWFDRGELLYVVKRPSALEPMLARPLVSAALSPLPCPRCTTPMQRGGVGSLQAVIERCETCGGIWLASGVRSRLDQISAAPGAPGVAAASATPQAAGFARPPAAATRPPSGKPRPLPRLPDLGVRSVMVLGALYGMTFLAMILAVAYVRLGLDVAITEADVAT